MRIATALFLASSMLGSMPMGASAAVVPPGPGSFGDEGVGRSATIHLAGDHLPDVGGCTLAAPDLSALAIWSRYPNPANRGSVMVPEALLAALDPATGCNGLVRDKSYVVELPSSRS